MTTPHSKRPIIEQVDYGKPGGYDWDAAFVFSEDINRHIGGPQKAHNRAKKKRYVKKRKK